MEPDGTAFAIFGIGPMVYWVPILHFYQPPTQFPAVLKRICDEFYRPLIALFGEFERGRATVNFNGSLTQMLQDCGDDDIVQGLRRLAEDARIELLGSAMYEPTLPLIPELEIERQIQLNLATNRRAFGAAYAPRGFFHPELAYGPIVGDAVARTGHEWVLSAGVACATEWSVRIVHRVEGQPKLTVLFLDDFVSNRISFVILNAMKAVTSSGFDDRCRAVADDHYEIAENLSHRVHDVLLAA